MHPHDREAGLVTHRFQSSAAAEVSFQPPHAPLRHVRVYELQGTTPDRLAWFETAVYVPPAESRAWTDGASAVECMSFRLHRMLQGPDARPGDCRWLYVVHTDIPDDISDEYNAWYDEEHLPRLVRVPGIVRARRYVSPDQSPRYLTAYELSDRDAFSSPAGLKARDTQWTARMRTLFYNTRRFTGQLLEAK